MAEKRRHQWGSPFTLIFVAVSLFALLMGALQLSPLRLRGIVSDHITLDGRDFLAAMLESAEETLELPAGTHGIFLCPSSIPETMRPRAPADFTVSNLRIYEFTDDYREKNGQWTGKRYGFGQSGNDTLTILSPAKRYYVHAAQDLVFSCALPQTVSSAAVSSSPPPPSSAVYVTDKGTSRILKLDGALTAIYDAADGVRGPTSIVLDRLTGNLYWLQENAANPQTTVIMRGNADGTPVTTLLDAGNVMEKLKVDISGRHLYWIDDDGAVIRSDMNASNITRVALGPALDFAVDAPNGHVYWTDAATGAIRRTTIIGGAMSTVYTQPDALLDRLFIIGNMLYWTQRVQNGANITYYIYRGDTQGQNIQQLNSLQITSGMSLTVHEFATNDAAGHIYWTFTLVVGALRENMLVRATLLGEDLTTIYTSPSATWELYGIAL